MAGVKQFDEAQTLESALQVFWRKGYAQTSMQDLAQATGVLRGSLYNAYGDKEALFLLAYLRHRERFVRQAGEAIDKPALDIALRDFFDYIIGSITTGTPTRGCLTTKMLTDDSVEGEPLRETLRALIDGLEAHVLARLQRPDAQERLALPPEEAARLVIAHTRGIVVLERIYHDPERLRDSVVSLIKLLVREPAPAVPAKTSARARAKA